MKKMFVVIVCLLSAAMTVSAVQARETIVVATDYWPPFRIEQDRTIQGLDTDIMRIIGQRMNVDFAFIHMPWARCLEEMRRGGVDMMTGLARTPERAVFIAYSDHVYYTCAPAFYARADSSAQSIAKYDDLVGYTIGFTRDSAYFEPFDSDVSLTKKAGNNEMQVLRMVLENRWDLFVGTDCQVDYDLARLKLTQDIKKILYRPEKRVDLYMGFSKRSSFRSRQAEFDAVLKAMIEDGTIKRLAEEYFKSPG